MPRARSIALAHSLACGPIPRTFKSSHSAPPLDAADLLRHEVIAERTEAARLVAHVQRDLLEAMIEDPHYPRVPTDPHAAAQVLGRRGVIGLGHLDVAVAIDRALRFLE